MTISINKYFDVARLGAVLFLLLVSAASYSQGRVKTLQELQADNLALRSDADARIIEYVKAHPDAKVSFHHKGTFHLMVDVSAGGVPIYEKTFNALEAATLNVPALRSGGSLGINVLGTGIRLGTWDGGRVRNDHVELTGRVTQVDGSPSFDDHATHTSGTMMATGLNPSAKGMAPEATLSAFDFDNDVSEMISQAKSDQTTLILSNHSYGTECGWEVNTSGTWEWHGDASISTTEDYKFGFYDSKSNQWDVISVNAPYYLIVKAAGNDRSDYNGAGPQAPDGPYDCIPTFGVAKNILTVGAVQNLTTYTGPSDVLPTSFSSWGPTDDGRIKPDIVAPGFNVFSTVASSVNAYATESGTSMSTPATTGTLGLLQQLYKSLNAGSYMRSATVKALVIHTAREAGTSAGPDYSFGWGLLDAKGAADVVIKKDNQNVFINEATLTNGQTYEMNLGVPKAGSKITATLVWTDPAGTPAAASLDPTAKMLVNDLDLRLVDDGGTQKFPWILNPANPSAIATSGDNTRDNVEKIEFSNPDPRVYKLRVTNKGTLSGGSQKFSLVLTYSSVVDPKITYYWIGNSGTWSDGTHWSLTSGGAPANAVPGADNRVVFDENSFTLDNQSVSITAAATCYSLRWFAQEPADFSLNANTLTIGESLALLTSKITTSTTGSIALTSAVAATNAVDLNSNVLDKWSLTFSGNSAWQITGSASVNQITHTQGTLTFSGTALKINQLVASGASAKTVAFTSASLKALLNLSVDFTGATIQSDNLSSIIALPSVTNSVNIASGDFEGLIDVQGGDVTVTGPGQVRSIQGNGIVRINGGVLVPNLTLSGGSQLVLQESSTQTFSDKFAFATSSSSRVIIKSSGPANATLAFNGYYKICLDNVDVQNVDVTGTSVVNAGPGSTVVNSLNWLKANCGDILFPDFTVNYSCAKSSVYFIDKSSGPISSRSWNFGDAGSGQNTSSLASPLHFYSAGGPFTAMLTVNGTGGTRSTSKGVNLQSNVLPDNTVQWNGGNIISTVVAQTYQWLKDDQIIPAANSRFYSPTGTSGSYAVLIFDTNCNKRSSTFLVTAVADETVPSKEIKVYPIPTSDVLQVESSVPIVSASLMDVVGREVQLEMEKTTENRYRMNVSAMPTGLYILKVTTLERVELKKIIIRK